MNAQNKRIRARLTQQVKKGDHKKKKKKKKKKRERGREKNKPHDSIKYQH